MFMYCICTQYLVGAPFALITVSIRGMEVISLWHCWGGMEAQVSLTVAFSSTTFFDLLFLIFLLTIPHRFSTGFRSGEFAGTPTPWSFNQLLVLLAVWAGFQKTQWTNTSRCHCTPNHHRLWKLNTGLQATWAMSFSTLLPDSRTLVSKWKILRWDPTVCIMSHNFTNVLNYILQILFKNSQTISRLFDNFLNKC